jgi:hypothetical protein
MKCLSDGESAEWCRAHGYPATDRGAYGRPAPTVDQQYELVGLNYPGDPGLRVRLARDILQEIMKGSEVLLWVDQWDVWPRSQHGPLFARFRQACGEMRPLIEAPGHLFSGNELDDALSVLVVSLLFYWDCHAFSAARGPVFFCCHDEWCGFFITPGDDSARLSATFNEWLERKGDKGTLPTH